MLEKYGGETTHINIVKSSSAEATYTKAGDTVNAGKKLDRLQLGENSETRFNVAVIVCLKGQPGPTGIFKQIYIKLRFIELKNEKGDTIYVNVNSLMKRLHLSKEEVTKLKGMTPEVATATLLQKATMQTKIIDNYDALFTKYESSNYKLKRQTGINKETLMKIIKTGVHKLHDPQGVMQAKAVEFEHKKFTCIVQKKDMNAGSTDNKIALILQKEKLGAGTFGNVYESVVVNTGEKGALKIAKNESEIKEYYADRNDPISDQMASHLAIVASNDALEEHENLVNINERASQLGTTVGIQRSPNGFIHIETGDTIKKESEKLGYLGKIYNRGDLSKMEDVRIDVKLNQGSQILQGLSTLAQLNVRHGDIKPKNIMVHEEKSRSFFSYLKGIITGASGKLRTDISDLGGARFMPTDAKDMDQKEPTSTSTDAYKSKTCSDRAKQYLIQAKLSQDPVEKQQYLDLSNADDLRNDLFATGLTLYEYYTGTDFPGSTIKGTDLLNESSLRPQAARETLKQSGVPDDIIKLILEMVDVNKKPDLSAQDVSKRYETALTKYNKSIA